MCVCVCKCACVFVYVEWTWSMHYIGISTYQFFPYYACVHTQAHTHKCILIPFEDSEPKGLKADIAQSNMYLWMMVVGN